MKFQKKCKWCGQSFESDAANARYCSDGCRYVALKEQRAKYMTNYRKKMEECGEIIRECKWCGRAFKPFQAQKYCCVECREAATGVPISTVRVKRKKTKPKMTLAQTAKAAAEAGMSYGEYVIKKEVMGW